MTHLHRVSLTLLVAACGTSGISAYAAEGQSGRRIEEVVVTAERRESTVQDTAISITAFNADFIKEFGLRNQEDLQNYLPATTIQPYDISVRGVGRLFRAAGGDPGVATYFNGAYSEDFGIASTEGGLYDMERIEVLRGPQGTLYGRNGIGGAVNFHSARPTFTPEAEVRTVQGNFKTQEYYGFMSGPLIEDTLAARFTGIKRKRNGLIHDISENPDIGNYGDENYALALLFTPSDDFTFHVRGNERSYRRIFSSAQGAGAVVVSENGGRLDNITGGKRNSTARVNGYRVLDTSVNGTLVSAASPNCANFTDRTAPNCTITAAAIPVGSRAEYDPTILTFSATAPIATTIDTNFNRLVNDAGGFMNINAGDVVTRRVQRVVAGVDAPRLQSGGGALDGFARPNWNFGAPVSALDSSYVGRGTKLENTKGGELNAYTNGFNDEAFDHQNVVVDTSWQLSDWLTVKYIGAYTDYIYHRTSDDDRTGNNFGGLDIQFIAIQENENQSHEMQFWFDIGDNMTITSGAFYYSNQIDQRLDFYSENNNRFTQPGMSFNATTGAVAPMTGVMFTADTARDSPQLCGGGGNVVAGLNNFPSDHVELWCFSSGPWVGDRGTAVQHGPGTDGTSFVWDTINVTKAYAAYGQWEWQMNDQWAITLGGRYSRDDKRGTESLFLYRETTLAPATLLAYNVATGALNSDGTPTAGGANETIPIRFRGVPSAQSLYRRLSNRFQDVTWRVNFDYTPVDDHLFYLSATTGHRAGGFNLGFYSAVPTYDPEHVLAFELGHKGQFFDGTLQTNSSIYHYSYEDINLQQSVEGLTGISTSVFNGPDAENYGFETEITWLPTDAITLGLTYSYTKTEYLKSLIDPVTGEAGVVIQTEPNVPPSVFETDLSRFRLKGNSLNRVAENKASGYFIYSFPLGDSGKLDFLTSYSWQDEVPFEVTNSPLDVAPAFGRWDARLTWKSADEAYEIQGFVNNITDEIGIRNMDREGESQAFMRTIEPTNPRAFGVDIRWRFKQ